MKNIKLEIKVSTAERIRRFNFYLFNQIMDKDFGVIYCFGITDPNKEVFHEKIGYVQQ